MDWPYSLDVHGYNINSKLVDMEEFVRMERRKNMPLLIIGAMLYLVALIDVAFYISRL